MSVVDQQNHLHRLPEDLQQLIWYKVWRNQMKTIEKDIKIEFVLKQFKAMFGHSDLLLTNMILDEERQRLQSYEKYYRYWCDDIFTWCE